MKNIATMLCTPLKCYFIYSDHPKPIEKELIVISVHYHYEGRRDFNGEVLPNVRVWDDGKLYDETTKEFYVAKGEEPLYFRIDKPQPINMNKEKQV